MKKFVSIVLCVFFAFAMLIPAYAETDNKLRFNEDGNFRIMQISDIQDGTLLTPAAKKFIKEVVIEAKPDLVVLTGDNISAGSATVGIKAIDLQLVKYGISNYMSVFEEIGVPVAIVFGNHDAEQIVSKEEQMAFYSEYDCCLAVDEGDALYGCGTYNLPVFSSNGTRIKFNVWVFDSNDYDENGKYSCVQTDQIEWYKKRAEELKNANGGSPLPAILFQHVPVDDMGNLFEECNFWDEGASIGDDGKCYRLNQEIASGYHAGAMIPGATTEQFRAWKECGDVLGAYFGHWHTEGYTGTWDGIELGFTYGCEFAKPGPYGVRVFTLYENDIKNFDNELYTYEGSYKSGASLELQVDEPYAVYDNAVEEFFAAIKNVFVLLKTEIVSLFA